MMRVTTHLLIGARAIATALLLSLVPLLIPVPGAHAEILPIPMNVQYDVPAAHGEESATAKADDALPEGIITVLESSNGDPEQIGDEILPLVALPRPIVAESIALFSERSDRPHGDTTPCWRPPAPSFSAA